MSWRTVLFLIALILSPACTAKIVLKLAYSDVEFYPYQIGNGSEIHEPPGVALEIIKSAAKNIGVEVEFFRRPNKRTLTELIKGKADGAFCFSFKESRLEYGIYPMLDGQLDRTRRIATVSYYLYKKLDSPLEWNGSDFYYLHGALGGNAGNSIVSELRKKGLDVEEVKNTEKNLKKLKMGRIAGYAAQDVTTDPHISTGRYGEIIKLPVPLATKDYFLIFSHQFKRKHPELVEEFWNEIGNVREALGDYTHLMN